MGIPHPAEATCLMGHQSLFSTLLQAYESPKPPHAWLFMGDHGVGKATVAYQWASHVLSGALPGDPTFLSTQKAILARSHPDMKVIEAPLGEPLTIQEIRSLTDFMHTTAVGERGRLALVDGAHLMTRQAANALLKILEEPPSKTVLVLVAQGAVLPTLRSRCRVLRFSPLSDSEMEAFFHHFWREKKEDLSPDIWNRVRLLAGGSGGRLFLFLEEECRNLLQALDDLFSSSRINLGDLMKVCRSLKGNKVAFRALILAWIRDQARKSSDRGERGRDLAFARLWAEVNEIFSQALESNLDLTQTLVRALVAMAQTWKKYSL